MTRKNLLKSPTYWFEYEQNELYRQVSAYMERENINKTELAKRLKVSKGYVSQILNGNFNYTLKKLIELGLAIGIVPHIEYKQIESVIQEDKQNQQQFENIFSFPIGDDECKVISIDQPDLNTSTTTLFYRDFNISITEPMLEQHA